jgi:hypothetical protein
MGRLNDLTNPASVANMPPVATPHGKRNPMIFVLLRGVATIATSFLKTREKRNRDVLQNWWQWWQWWQPLTSPRSYGQKPFRLRFDRR